MIPPFHRGNVCTFTYPYYLILPPLLVLLLVLPLLLLLLLVLPLLLLLLPVAVLLLDVLDNRT